MGYRHGMTAQPGTSVLTVERARLVNAELRRELATLTGENTVLAPKVDAMRKEVTAARKKLARQIRDLEAIRIQTANIAAHAQHLTNTGTEPVYGGPEGLRAAADEMKAYEDGALNLSTVPRGRKGPRHGTGRRYALGCRCDSCLEWRGRKTAQEVARNKARRAEFQAMQEAVAS